MANRVVHYANVAQLALGLNQYYYGRKRYGVTRPVHDATGLTGTYDIPVPLPEPGAGTNLLAVIGRLGLEAKPAPGLETRFDVLHVDHLRESCEISGKQYATRLQAWAAADARCAYIRDNCGGPQAAGAPGRIPGRVPGSGLPWRPGLRVLGGTGRRFLRRRGAGRLRFLSREWQTKSRPSWKRGPANAGLGKPGKSSTLLPPDDGGDFIKLQTNVIGTDEAAQPPFSGRASRCSHRKA